MPGLYGGESGGGWQGRTGPSLPFPGDCGCVTRGVTDWAVARHISYSPEFSRLHRMRLILEALTSFSRV